MSGAFCKKSSVYPVLFLAISILFIYSVVSAEDNSTFQDLGLYGGQVNSIAVSTDNSSIVFAGTWLGGGLFKSTDAGENWTIVPGFKNISVADIAIDPNNTSNVWVANGHYIDVSRDRGATWETYFFAYNEDRFCYSVAVDPHDDTGNTVYVGTGGSDDADTYGEVFYTTNGGKTWKKQGWLKWYLSAGGNSWDNFRDIAFNPNAEGEVWLANDNSTGLIFMSENYGAGLWPFWTGALLDGGLNSFGPLYEIVVHPVNGSIVFAAGKNGIARKTEGSAGGSWAMTEVDSNCRAICVSPFAPHAVYGGLAGTIVKSIDSGISWENIELEIEGPGDGLAAFLTLAADPADSQTVYGGEVAWGVFKSSDGAGSWDSSNQGILANTVFDTGVDSEDNLVSGTMAGIYLQADNGTWQMINPYVSYTVDFHPDDDNVVFAGQEWEIAKSSDRGKTWSYLDVSSDGEFLRVASVEAVGDDNNTVFAGIRYGTGSGGGVVKVIDDGEDFSELSFETLLSTIEPVNTVRVSPADSDVILAGTGYFYAPETAGGIYRSSNGGDSWTEVLSGLIVNEISVSAADSDLMFAACGGSSADSGSAGIYKSTDNGLTWEKKITGLPDKFSVSDIKIDDANADIVYAALFKGFNDCYDDECIYLNGIYISVNGGEYWTQIGLSDYYIYDVNSFGSTAASLRGRSLSYPETTVVAGTGSGAYSSSMSTGRGTISGRVMDADDPQKPVTDAVIKTDTGSKCMTEETGHYMLFVASGKHRVSFWSPTHVSENVPNVSVGTGQDVTLDANLKEGGSDPSSSTCFLEDVLGARSSQLGFFRSFRDDVLSRTSTGRYFTDLYYKLGPDVSGLLNESPVLKKKCLEIIAGSSKLIKTFLSDDSFENHDSLLSEISSFLSGLEKSAGSDLKKELSGIRREMKLDSFLEKISSGNNRNAALPEPVFSKRKRN